jgi:hypothetical protein
VQSDGGTSSAVLRAKTLEKEAYRKLLLPRDRVSIASTAHDGVAKPSGLQLHSYAILRLLCCLAEPLAALSLDLQVPCALPLSRNRVL